VCLDGTGLGGRWCANACVRGGDVVSGGDALRVRGVVAWRRGGGMDMHVVCLCVDVRVCDEFLHD